LGRNTKNTRVRLNNITIHNLIILYVILFYTTLGLYYFIIKTQKLCSR